MSFSRRHYEEVARIIRTVAEESATVRAGSTTPTVLRDASSTSRSFYAIGSDHARAAIHSRLVAMFAADNPRFDATRFDMACEPRSGK